jgi:uncharacterized protein (TIGR01777 family)
MKIVVAGGTGFVGRSLVARLLQEGHTVTVLTRTPAPGNPHAVGVRMEQWDARSPGTWTKAIDGADAVVNLAGELIAGKRWTRRQKADILNSRVDATRSLVGAIGDASSKPALLINGSAVGYYGDMPSGDVTETSEAGGDFLATVCRRWEESAHEASAFGVRVVTPRLGIVLGSDGGMLQRLVPPFKLYAGGYLGSGRQWMPWIHVSDLVDGFLFVMKHPELHGPVNFTSPEPVTMKEFCRLLGRVIHRPSWTFVPEFVLKIGVGEMSHMLLTGQRAVPEVLLRAGFRFSFPSLEPALRSILSA